MRSAFSPVKSSALAKAMLDPSCETAAAGARDEAMSEIVGASKEISAVKARSCAVVSDGVSEAVDSKTT